MSQASADQPGAVARLVAGWIAWVVEGRVRSVKLVLIALLVALASLLYGTRIRVDTDLRALLPKSAPSVLALDTLEARKGTAERLVVAVESPDLEGNASMVDELATEVSGWPETRSVSVTQDFTTLRDHALYFLDVAQLDELGQTLADQRKLAVARTMSPGLSDDPIDSRDIAAVEGGDWDDPGELDSDSAPSEAPAVTAPMNLDELLAAQREQLVAQGRLSEEEVDLIWPRENDQGEVVWEPRVEKPLESEAGQVRVLEASLSHPATDVQFAQEVVERIETRVADAQARGIATDARVQVVAAYDVSKEVDTIVRDAGRATWISAALVIAVLGFGFWSARALVLVLVPMAVSMAMTLALATVLYGELNALTVFLFAVLFGMGVDFAVHLYAQRQAQGLVADWPAVILTNLRPLSATMLTTVGCLSALGLAQFQAFRQFGIISALGVAICFASALFMVPAIDSLLGPLRRTPKAGTAKAPGLRVPAKFVRLLRAARIAVVVALAVFGMVGAPKLAFERDTRALRSRTADGAQAIHYTGTAGRCAKTLALIADDPEDLDRVVALLEAEKTQLLPGAVDIGVARKPWVREVFSLRTLLPEDQRAKQRSLEPLAELTNGFLAELPDLDAEAQNHRSYLEVLERLSKAKPLEVGELPQWAVEPFTENNGRSDRIAHACLDIAGWSIDELIAVRARLDLLTEGTTVLPADSRLVFADLMTLVEHDARSLPIVSLLIMAMFVALDLRKLTPTLICLVSLGLGLLLSLAIMGEGALRLNFFNIVVMPAVVGLGIDASIHLWHARSAANLGATSRAAIIATLTTIAGFSGLLAAEHLGLRSIGELGILALSACVGVAFLVLYPVREHEAC